MSMAELSHEQRNLTFETVLTTLEETAGRVALYETQIEPAISSEAALHRFSPLAWQALVSDTMQLASEIITHVGGMPLAYRDSHSDELVQTTAFLVQGYDLPQDTWIIATSPSGKPPQTGQQFLSLSCTTPELREAFEQAQHAPQDEGLHPGEL